MGFPGWLSGRESTCQCRRHGLDPWVERSPGEGNDNSLQYSCLENSMDGRVWWATVHGVTKTRTQLSKFTFFLSIVPFGEGNGNPLQCSCLENPMDGEAWWAAIYEVTQSRTRLK